MPMDRSVDQFYINYRHPIIQEGRVFLGTVVLRNNNPNGFVLKLASTNQSFLSNSDALPNQSPIPYSISIEKNNGTLGDGVMLGYSENEEFQLVTERILLSSFNQTSYTDISLSIYIHINQSISDRLLAGNYLDEIDVIYENQVTI